MARFKLNEKVIAFNDGKFEVAIILSRSVMKQRRVFDIKTESGFILPFVPVDDVTCKAYIDSKKTSKLIPKVVTNLSEFSKGNVK